VNFAKIINKIFKKHLAHIENENIITNDIKIIEIKFITFIVFLINDQNNQKLFIKNIKMQFFQTYENHANK